LATALEQIEADFPRVKGRYLDDLAYEGAGVYEDLGIRREYLRLTEKYLRELEHEANVKEPMQFDSRALTYEDEN